MRRKVGEMPKPFQPVQVRPPLNKREIMEKFKDDYDWKEAFGFADFSMDDVEKVLHHDPGHNDGDPWIMAGVLKDGRYFFLSAWCDYTGWDCQSGGHSNTTDTEESLYKYLLGEEERRRFGLKLLSDKN